jgi:hypothetical protein
MTLTFFGWNAHIHSNTVPLHIDIHVIIQDFQICKSVWESDPTQFRELSSFSSLRSNFCVACLLTDSLSLTFAATKVWSVTQSVRLKYRTSNEFDCRLYPSKTWSICVFPSEVQVCLQIFRCSNIVLLIIRIPEVVKFITLPPLSILVSWRLSFSTSGFKIPYFPAFALKS